MDWEWVYTGPEGREDRFTIKLRRAIRNGVCVGVSLTLTDRPHDGDENETKDVFKSVREAFDITGPLCADLRAEGWELKPSE
ncbi:hypothetical protein [Streptomyces spectabilis]|uniref:Uncharacterized protein n=1 Tax=Streptomyces spectabilis TaxID=68270 RepID=A0A516RF62_STRST|nr:hypothetical protein [Streptomyces spectabilis]QDQ14302.1 hypothetical protein FH965_30110 [Streptomyces spectabilis]